MASETPRLAATPPTRCTGCRHRSNTEPRRLLDSRRRRTRQRLRRRATVGRRAHAGAESVTSLSATPTGNGYWLFTTLGRALAYGDAPFLGDMSSHRLNGAVLDSVPTPTGRGYYMV